VRRYLYMHVLVGVGRGKKVHRLSNYNAVEGYLYYIDLGIIIGSFW